MAAACTAAGAASPAQEQQQVTQPQQYQHHACTRPTNVQQQRPLCPVCCPASPVTMHADCCCYCCCAACADLTRAVAVVSNHCGWVDILIHMARYFPAFVARDGTQNLPMVGLIRCASREPPGRFFWQILSRFGEGRGRGRQGTGRRCHVGVYTAGCREQGAGSRQPAALLRGRGSAQGTGHRTGGAITQVC